MKSSGAAVKILLDTSFILPTLGVSVTGVTSQAIKSLAEASQVEIHYSRFSVLESLWVATRIPDATFDNETFKLGLRSITAGHRYSRIEEDSEVFNEAFRLYKLGHKDMIDNILYSTATQMGLLLLTLDDELKKFAHEKQLKYVFLSPHDLPSLTKL